DRGGLGTPGGIASQLGVSFSTTTGLVERLVQGGYVRRLRSRGDRRLIHLRLQAKGRRLMAAFRRLRRSRLQTLLSRIGTQDAKRMADALETLNEIVGRWKDSG